MRTTCQREVIFPFVDRIYIGYYIKDSETSTTLTLGVFKLYMYHHVSPSTKALMLSTWALASADMVW